MTDFQFNEQTWTLTDEGESTYKITNGQRQFTFQVDASGHILSYAAGSRLKTVPGLQAATEAAIASQNPPLNEHDPYGDLALARNLKLTDEQNAMRLQSYTRQHKLGAKVHGTDQESAYRAILTAYYAGEYKPHSLATMNAQFDLLEDNSDLL